MALILFRVCPESVIDSRFFFQRNSRFFRTKLFACTLISCCSIVNDLAELSLCSCLAVLLDSLTIIPHPLGFVKGFFKSFLKTFSTTFQPERKCPSIISHPLAFVKRFFKSFFNFFRDFLRGRLSRSPAR